MECPRLVSLANDHAENGELFSTGEQSRLHKNIACLHG